MVDGEGRPPEKPASGTPGWDADVLLPVDLGDPAVAAARRRRRWRVLGAAAIAATALALWSIVGRRAGGPEPTLAVRLDRGGAPVRPPPGDSEAAAAVGDRVVLEVTGPGRRHVEVRMFREGGSLLLRCPGSLRCQRLDGRLVGELLLTAPGRYQALMAVAERPLPAPAATFAADSDSLRAAGARLVVAQPIVTSAPPPAE